MHEHMRSNRACARKAVDPMAAFIDQQGARSPPQGDNNGFTDLPPFAVPLIRQESWD